MTVTVPTSDEDVPAFWRGLGLPGLIDVHVHVLPDRLTRKIWDYFAAAGPAIGRDWPIRYAWPMDQRLAHLRAMGVRAFSSLPYPHKPGMASWLNDWSAELARAEPDVLSSMTMYPEPGVDSYVRDAIEAGARIAKVHVQVGDFDPRDPLLDDAWGLLAEAGIPVVTHAGNGPVPGTFTGVGPMTAVLDRHPQLRLVVAHMGMPDFEDFLDLTERYDRVMLDTTMCFTDFTGTAAAGRRLAPRLAEAGNRILLGSDFPTIPYPYAHQLEALVRLGLGEEWLRGVCWSNAATLFGIDAAQT